MTRKTYENIGGKTYQLSENEIQTERRSDSKRIPYFSVIFTRTPCIIEGIKSVSSKGKIRYFPYNNIKKN